MTRFPLQVAMTAKRPTTASFLSCWRRMPSYLRFIVVQRGQNNRAFSIFPTFHGGLAIACILLAYVYWAAVLLPRTWSAMMLSNLALVSPVLSPRICDSRSNLARILRGQIFAIILGTALLSR